MGNSEFLKLRNSFFGGKKILVTGASGYLANNLIGQLADEDCSIVRLSRREFPKSVANRKAKIEDIQGDICDPMLWHDLLRKVDVVYHLAAQTSVYVAEDDPEADWRINVLPMLNILQACRKNHYRPMIVFAGTVTEAGIPPRLPVNEQQCDMPVTVYDLHKLWAEQYLRHYVRLGIVSGCVLRLANVYGPGPKSSSADRGIINLMMLRAISGKELTVYGTGEFIRDYVYIDDVVEAFLRASIYVEKVNGRYFVIGSGKGTTIVEAINMVADRVAARTSKRVDVRHIDPPDGLSVIESRNFIADTNSYNVATGWLAAYSLVDGIDKTLDAVFNTVN
ncbi:MAG: NAD-dependent epimerase/dehydratase family protein [Nitrospirae bacterium]|nr:MAG: NAD-dependent epimerase/dehydratase family protein [Nitrospirota bacterium]